MEDRERGREREWERGNDGVGETEGERGGDTEMLVLYV